MHPRWLALLLALVLSFSGCLGFLGEDDPDVQDEEEDDPTDTPDDEVDPDPAETEDPDESEEETNEPPEATLTADLTTGEAPLNVSFTLDGSDADEDPLTWTLDLGDGSDVVEGDELPYVLEHAYAESGNFTAVLTVSDGNETDSAQVELTVAQPADPILDTSVSWGPPGNAGCASPYDVWEFGTPLAGVLVGELDLPAEAVGAEFTIHMSGTTIEAGFLMFDFYDSEGSLLDLEQDTFAFDDELTVKGEVPDEAAWVLFADCLTEGGGEADILIV